MKALTRRKRAIIQRRRRCMQVKMRYNRYACSCGQHTMRETYIYKIWDEISRLPK